ncbi:MAG: alpha/beta fold hydrolase, partial [Micromonosporaceae bacterium]
MPTIPAAVDTLAVPGAQLHYELRGEGPLVVLAAAPMDADSFAPLADLLAVDHTVLTTDPRGINRSTVDDRDRDSTPELRADDLARLITHVDAGRAAVLGSSGGAVSVLALVQAHPEMIHTVIAHEPPLDELLDDREELRVRTDDMIATYQAGDPVGAMRKFLAVANINLPEEVFLAMFGGERTPQRVADDDFQFARMLRPTTRWLPDLDLLRSSPTRVVVGIGEESGGQLCDRT